MIALLLSPKAWAGAAAGIGLAVIFYEGVPLGPLRHIPLLASIADGRVDRVAAAAVAAERAAALERSMELIRKRFETNAQIDGLDDAGLCGELGGKWVPDRQLCE